ncbi:MAG: PAS domain-containing protein [Pseudomonadota bacterium]
MSIWLPNPDELNANPELLTYAMERYSRVLECDGYGFWEWDMVNDTYISGGRIWENLGYSAQIVGDLTKAAGVQEYVHPDDWDHLRSAVVHHLRFNTPVVNMIYRIRAFDGSYMWTQACVSSTRDENGRAIYLNGINIDLSHLKQTEKQLRLSQARHERVLSASNDGIWEWSAIDANSNPRKAGRIGKLHTSHSYWAQLGYAPTEVDALPETERLEIWKSHIHPHDFPLVVRKMMGHFKTRIPVDVEYRVFGEGGQMRWIRSRGQGIFNTYGRMILMSGINIDITEMKQSEENVRKAKEDAERANRSKSNFLSSISHELRTPLNSILGFSKLLAEDKLLDTLQRENAQYIHKAGRHLLQLINDVLDLAQIEAGKLPLSMETINPCELVREVFVYCKNSATDNNITVDFDPSTLSHCLVEVDPMRLRQCLLNLLNNAIKYNVNGGHVQVNFADVKGALEISVQDTGPGIPEEKLPYLFEMFNRLGAERSTVEGTGIGLVITQQLVLAMGGTLSYENIESGGACFKMVFPVVAADVQTLKAIENSGNASQALSLDFGSQKKVCYIEDNESNIRLLESCLSPYSQLRVSSHTDPIKGLYRVRTDLPDMVLLDINLPGINGYEILEVLKQDPLTQHLPVVALSASAMAKDIDRGLAMGFDAYLTKPLDIEKLSDVLNSFFTDIEAGQRQARKAG